jgi:pimeloyl-ACP methyl ester carboxylesterase
MGGALTQWYLKYIGDNLPAAVFVASWVSHSVRADAGASMLKMDPAIAFWALRTWDATPWVRNPRRAAEKLLGPKAAIRPEALHDRLGPESVLVAFQHNTPCWHPPEKVNTPNLWLAGELDAVVSVDGTRRSAWHYRGDFTVIPEAGHNLMMEHNARATARHIHDWLAARNIE